MSECRGTCYKKSVMENSLFWGIAIDPFRVASLEMATITILHEFSFLQSRAKKSICVRDSVIEFPRMDPHPVIDDFLKDIKVNIR